MSFRDLRNACPYRVCHEELGDECHYHFGLFVTACNAGECPRVALLKK